MKAFKLKSPKSHDFSAERGLLSSGPNIQHMLGPISDDTQEQLLINQLHFNVAWQAPFVQAGPPQGLQ